MGIILRADSEAVRSAVSAEIQAHTAEREARGEHKEREEAYFGFRPRLRRQGLERRCFSHLAGYLRISKALASNLRRTAVKRSASVSGLSLVARLL